MTISGTAMQSVVVSVTAVAASITRSRTEGTASAPTPPSAPASSPSKADTLMRALDRDKDGAISKAEFTEGAIALLRRAAGRQYAGGDGPSGAAERRHHGMANRLARVFDRIDANDDGSIDVNELAARLGRRSGPAGEPPAPPSSGDTASFTAVAISVTMVALQRYSAVSQIADTPAAS